MLRHWKITYRSMYRVIAFHNILAIVSRRILVRWKLYLSVCLRASHILKPVAYQTIVFVAGIVFATGFWFWTFIAQMPLQSFSSHPFLLFPLAVYDFKSAVAYWRISKSTCWFSLLHYSKVFLACWFTRVFKDIFIYIVWVCVCVRVCICIISDKWWNNIR